MEDTRTMKDDLRKAGQTPSSVAAVFNDSLQGRASASSSATDSLNSSNPADLGIGSSAVASPSRPPSNLPFADVEPPKEQNIPSYQAIDSQLPPVVPPPVGTDNGSDTYEFYKKPFVKWVIMGGMVLLIFSGGFFAYTKLFFSEQENVPVVENNFPIPETPESLISVANTIEIALDPTDNLVDLMKEKVNGNNLIADSFYQVVVYDNTTSAYLGLSEVLSKLNSKIPDSINALLGDDYTLFVYKQNEGLRYGLAVKTSGDISSQLAQWESTMLEDLSFLFTDSKTPVPNQIKFIDNKYQEKSLRYVNLIPNSSVYSLDYILIDGTFFITTSKKSMFALIDQL